MPVLRANNAALAEFLRVTDRSSSATISTDGFFICDTEGDEICRALTEISTSTTGTAYRSRNLRQVSA